MEVVNIILVKNNVVDGNTAIIGSSQGGVQYGEYRGKSLSEAADIEFYKMCRKINPNLPEEMLSDEVEIQDMPDDYPEFESDYYEFGDYYLCINWACMT